MAVVTFNYAEFQQQFPEFFSAGGSQTLAQFQGYFNTATLYLNNTDCSLVQDANPGGARDTILNLLTAHVAALFGGVNGQAPTGLVGRISDATEGSTSVSTSLDGLPAAAQWWAQTPYGLAAWQALAPYRTARYRASLGRFAQGAGGPFRGVFYGGFGNGYPPPSSGCR